MASWCALRPRAIRTLSACEGGFAQMAGRELLEQLGLEGPAWRTPRNFVGQAQAVLAATEKRGLEGVVAKRLDSPYKPGKRNGAWVTQAPTQRALPNHRLGTGAAQPAGELLREQATRRRNAGTRGKRLARPLNRGQRATASRASGR